MFTYRQYNRYNVSAMPMTCNISSNNKIHTVSPLATLSEGWNDGDISQKNNDDENSVLKMSTSAV